MAEALNFRYVAVDALGKRTKGDIAGLNDAEAFEALRTRGLTPLSLQQRKAAAPRPARIRQPSDRQSADFLSSLADLLRAGADIRTALNILGARSERVLKDLAIRLTTEISGGEPLERVFARSFYGKQAFVASMVAAGEGGGDLAGGLQRAAEVFHSRLKLRDQLVGVLAYPIFVFVSAIGALFVILLFIVPSIAPLAESAGGPPPLSLAVLIAASDFLRQNLLTLAIGLAALLGGLVIAGRMGMLAAATEALVLDGPAKRTVRSVVFGGFAVSLGTMLAAGAPATDALRLANRAVMMKAARRRLEPLVQLVRQGQPVSSALETVRGFPPAVVRLAAVGEATNSLGQMLTRGGKLEEDTATKRIEVIGRIAGPALIVMLGMVLGVLMGGLLTGVSQMGQAALG